MSETYLSQVSIAELKFAETGVGAVFRGEFVVRASFNHASAVEYNDAVGGAHGGEAVCDGEGGAALSESVEGVLYPFLRLGVERAGGFVE